MSSFEIIAIVVGVFFGLGLATGMLLVMSLPLLQAIRRNRRNRRRYRNSRNWHRLSLDDEDRRPPRWPGN